MKRALRLVPSIKHGVVRAPRLRHTPEEREADLQDSERVDSTVNLIALAHFLRERGRYREALFALYRLIQAIPPVQPYERARAWLTLADTIERIGKIDAVTASPDSCQESIVLDQSRIFVAHAVQDWPEGDLPGYLRVCERYIGLLQALGYTDTLKRCLPEVRKLRRRVNGRS